MTPLSKMCWDADIEAALLTLTRDKIKDRDYWSSTVARVEEGVNPKSNQRITVSELRAWVARCMTPPPPDKEETPRVDYQTRSVSPSNRCVPHL